MKMLVKRPGMSFEMAQTDLDLTYEHRFDDLHLPDAYERLILNVIRGEKLHFVRGCVGRRGSESGERRWRRCQRRRLEKEDPSLSFAASSCRCCCLPAFPPSLLCLPLAQRRIGGGMAHFHPARQGRRRRRGGAHPLQIWRPWSGRCAGPVKRFAAGNPLPFQLTLVPFPLPPSPSRTPLLRSWATLTTTTNGRRSESSALAHSSCRPPGRRGPCRIYNQPSFSFPLAPAFVFCPALSFFSNQHCNCPAALLPYITTLTYSDFIDGDEVL